MEIPKMLLNLKFHIIFATLFSLVLLSLIFLAPRFLTIVSYFWPLFVSTALFLIAIVVFGRFSPPANEISSEKAGEGILDYVAGKPNEEELLLQEEEEEKTHKADDDEKKSE